MGTASGKVTFGGAAPPEPMRIEFFDPLNGRGTGAKIAEDGTYELENSVQVGEYKVYFTPPPADFSGDTPPPPYVPLKSIPGPYTNEATTPLTKTIEEGDNTIDVEIPKG